MARQALKQDARRRVSEALSAKQKERLETERRQASLAIEVLTALSERDEAVQAAEQLAGAALRGLLGEQLNVAEIAQLCGGQVDVKELARLSRIPNLDATVTRSGSKS